MRRLLVLACFAFAGCSFIPWHPFGTAASRAQTAEKRVEQAQGKAGDVLTEEIHKTGYALDAAAAGKPEALEVARQHNSVARSLADQIFGTPTVLDEKKWSDLIARQTALDAEVRRIADAENRKRVGQIAGLSKDLADQSDKLAAANQKAVQAAAELQNFRDHVFKWVWAIVALFVLYFLGQILQFLANFNPAFESAANVVNAVVSPALHSAAHKARRALVAAKEA